MWRGVELSSLKISQRAHHLSAAEASPFEITQLGYHMI